MNERQLKLIVGSLLHDIGKVVYRSGDGRNHSQSGYEYLKNEAGIEDGEILDCVRYHHGMRLKDAEIPDNALAYITYYADNVASAVDRREGMEQEAGFDKKVPLFSVFNILNGNNGKSHYQQQVLDTRKGLFYPTEEALELTESFYREIAAQITDNLRGITYTKEYLNSLLSVLEANLSYIPSSTSRKELADISLYDHVKITAAAASCIAAYLEDRKITEYKKVLFQDDRAMYAEKMFLLYSMDISGIQSFIYTVGSQGALRGLRARSFYLEIVMEHMIDELLEDLSLSRANLIYSGGGHCYLLLPNTAETTAILDEHEKKTNRWFLDTFGIALYVGGGYAPCSADDLKNEPEGSYASLYQEISKMISGKKSHRYTADEIRWLNRRNISGERECVVCRRTGKTDENGKCPICAALEKISGSVLYQDFFTVIREPEEDALPLPGGKYLAADTQDSLKKRMDTDSYVRSYGKNNVFTGRHLTTKLWVGSYTTGDTFEQFAEKAEGIQRIGILRADVDNLGKTMIYGFRRPDGSDRYATLSRTAALSRQLSLFFKNYINHILENGVEDRFGGSGSRNVTIVYSGGDDVFLVGAWNDVAAAFTDLRQSFMRFTQGTLTISGGIGLYQSGYPINIMAKETGLLEDAAKENPGKNAVTLFEKDGMYAWEVFLSQVLGEKFRVIQTFFDQSDDHGKSFLYHLLELLRDSEDCIQTARFIYLLSRMEPEEGQEQKDAYKLFSRKMYEWIKEPEDRRQAITAMYLYIYLNRDREGQEEHEAG